jgi:hypothetical protein
MAKPKTQLNPKPQPNPTAQAHSSPARPQAAHPLSPPLGPHPTARAGPTLAPPSTRSPASAAAPVSLTARARSSAASSPPSFFHLAPELLCSAPPAPPLPVAPLRPVRTPVAHWPAVPAPYPSRSVNPGQIGCSRSAFAALSPRSSPDFFPGAHTPESTALSIIGPHVPHLHSIFRSAPSRARDPPRRSAPPRRPPCAAADRPRHCLPGPAPHRRRTAVHPGTSPRSLPQRPGPTSPEFARESLDGELRRSLGFTPPASPVPR